MNNFWKILTTFIDKYIILLFVNFYVLKNRICFAFSEVITIYYVLIHKECHVYFLFMHMALCLLNFCLPQKQKEKKNWIVIAIKMKNLKILS